MDFRNRRFDGAWSGPRRWEVFRRGAAAAMLPYDPAADVVVLIEQFRLPAHLAGLTGVMTELPAGLCDGAETPEQTIRREMVEEAGLSADLIEPVGRFLLTPGGADEMVTLFAGRVAAPAAGPDGLVAGTHGLASEQEDIRLRVWPAAAAIEAAVAGRFPNSVTSLGLLWFAARHAWLRAKWTP